MKFGLFLIFIVVFYSSVKSNNEYFKYAFLPELPSNSACQTQLGLAGLYTGINNDVLIVAGGTNFPDKLPWEGGAKIYYDEIFVLLENSEDEYSWKRLQQKLPFASAYGGAISTSEGLFCFGGNTIDKCISETWFINYLPETGIVKITRGPNLPTPLTNFAFSKIDNNIYVAGGISTIGGESVKYFFRLTITGDKPSNWKWESLPPWKGKPRAFAVGVSQSNGLTDCFYLFSGRNIQQGKKIEILYDAQMYDPSMNEWSLISDGKQKEFPFMAGTAFPIGASSIVFSSGANGEMMKKQLLIENKIAELMKVQEAGIDVERELISCQSELINHLNNHPGFGNQLTSFNTITNEIYNIGKLPGTGQVTTTAVRWGNDIIIPSGEIRPGMRTSDILKINIIKDSKKLNNLDFIIIALYFLVLACMGYFFSKRQKNANDYFKGGGRIPWWAAGLSIFGTALSAITFMAIPAKTFATDWSYFMLNMTIILVAPIIVFLFIPFYRKLNLTTAYEYLEVRFNLAIRLIGSLSFILFQTGRMGVVLFLPSIALSVVTGIDIFACIALMGIISLVYTMMGGIEAVVWTDVMQVIILIGGALLSVTLMISAIDGGFLSVVEIASANHKFNVIDLDWSLKQPTVWVMLVGGIFANITTYGTDQTMVQRYLTTNTKKEAGKSVWTNAFLIIPTALIFFFAGTALFAFYKNYPVELNPTFENNDAIFPWYVVSQLPAGISGLLIAAIFAAAMSSLSSSMNSAATAYATDIHFRFNWRIKTNELALARRATLVIGVLGILFAFMMATMDVKSLWDEFQKILGLILGSLGGVFLLGILSKKANAPGVIVGLGISTIIQVFVGVYQPVHLILYAATGFIACYIFGYLGSLFFKTPN